MPNPQQQTNPTTHPDVSRSIPKAVRDLLCIVAAGRCQLCNRFLFAHPTTLQIGNFSEAAHIVAFSVDGPRGDDPQRPEDINSIENLMLLCHDCHHTIDFVDPTTHPASDLIRKKREREAHVSQMMEMVDPERTAMIRFITETRSRVTGISFEDGRQAVFPRFPIRNPGTLIDLRGIPASGDAFVTTAKAAIDRAISELYSSGADASRAGHVSAFAIAPIPLLVYFGHRLSDMFPVALFPHDPDTNKWAWRDEGRGPIAYVTNRTREGTNQNKVALVLSLSGPVVASSLPASVDTAWSVYEMTMPGRTSAPGFLRQLSDLESFRAEYRSALATIKAAHPHAPEIHLFVAVPPPVAIACGLDRRREVQPPLVVYQNTESGFIPMLTINDHDA